LHFDRSRRVDQQVQRLLEDDQRAGDQRNRERGIVPIDQAHLDTTGTWTFHSSPET